MLFNLELKLPTYNIVICKTKHNSKTTFVDDIGTKRSLYESLEVGEYWIIDVENRQIIAYALTKEGSYRIHISQIFSELNLAILEEALRKSSQEDQSSIGQWLMTQFQQ